MKRLAFGRGALGPHRLAGCCEQQVCNMPDARACLLRAEQSFGNPFLQPGKRSECPVQKTAVLTAKICNSRPNLVTGKRWPRTHQQAQAAITSETGKRPADLVFLESPNLAQRAVVQSGCGMAVMKQQRLRNNPCKQTVGNQAFVRREIESGATHQHSQIAAIRLHTQNGTVMLVTVMLVTVVFITVRMMRCGC